jgi:zinc protease
MTLRQSAVLFLGLLAAPAVAARGDDAPTDDVRLAERTVAALYEGIQFVTLENGLRVYLKPVPGSPAVTTMVAYKVGSADEDLDNTGLSHYLEHLMFKGTDKLKPGDIDRITFRGGGGNNAYTGEDFTIFFFDFPADRWEAALSIEADRMRNLRIDEAHQFEQEKEAVVSELARNEDTPWDLESKAILPRLFGKTGPYGHPVIGQRSHVRGATAEAIKAHYDKWYHPNNAALVVVGGFDADRALAAIKKYFDDIPAAKLPPRKPVAAKKTARPDRLDMASKFATPRLLLGYNTVRSNHPDYPALQVLEEILGGGKTCRLYRTLVEGKETALSVSASNSGGRYPGWFAIQVEAVPRSKPSAIEKQVLAEVDKLRDEPPDPRELHRVQRGILATALFNRESVHGLADSIAQAVTVNDLDHLKNYLPRILAVTPERVREVARKYLDPQQRVTVWSQPEEDKGGKGDGGKGGPAPRARRQGPAGAAAAFSLGRTKRVELPNGLVLLLYEDHRLPLISAEAAVGHVRQLEPTDKGGVATLTGYLLDEGTTEHSADQIAERIEDVGGSLIVGASGGSVRVLAPDRALGLDLLLECLISPKFAREAFNRQKDHLRAEIDDLLTQPQQRARREFRKQAYGPHPLGRPSTGTLRSVGALTPEDCRNFHRRAFVPNNVTLAVVGDFDSQEIIDQVKRRTSGWKKADLDLPEEPQVNKPAEFTQKVFTMPEAAQLHVYLGHIGVRRDNPDYYKLLVMDYLLGTGPGFTDRLSSRLRDTEGLAYTVTATIAASADREPSLFTCYAGIDPANFARVKREFLEEINRIRDETPTAREVRDAQTYLLGSLLLQFTTGAGIASQLLMIERNRLGFDYLEDYRKAVAAVTPADVQAAARRYLNPKRMVLVAAGAIDAEGKPVDRAPAPKR